MAQPPSCPPGSLEVSSVQETANLHHSSSPLFSGELSAFLFQVHKQAHVALSGLSQEKLNMARRQDQQRPKPSMEAVAAAMIESDEDVGAAEQLSGDEGSAAMSGDAASPTTVRSDASEDEVLDEDAQQERSRQQGKGLPAALNEAATPAGDAAHVDAFGANFANKTASGAPARGTSAADEFEEGESAAAGAAKRQRTTDNNNGSRYAGSSTTAPGRAEGPVCCHVLRGLRAN